MHKWNEGETVTTLYFSALKPTLSPTPSHKTGEWPYNYAKFSLKWLFRNTAPVITLTPLHFFWAGEGRTGRQILEEALEKGYVLCSIIKILTLGAAGSGKTHTKFRLLRENPPKTRCSTPLTEAAIRAISRVLIGTDLTGWFRVSYEELMSMLAKALKAGVPMEAKEQHEAMRVGIQQLWETFQRSQKVKKASSASMQPSP